MVILMMIKLNMIPKGKKKLSKAQVQERHPSAQSRPQGQVHGSHEIYW